MPIEPQGRFLPVDDEGYLCRDTSQDNVEASWWPLIRAVIQAYKDHCGVDLHSVYLRGSVPRGLADPAVSDLDTIAVCNSEMALESPQWAEDASVELHREHGIGTGIEMTVIGMNHVREDGGVFPRIIATQALCVHGVDLIDAVPRYRPDTSMVCDARRLDSDIDQIPGWLQDPQEDNREVCRWIMKRMLRAGLEIHLSENCGYTRDLWICYSVFKAGYPDHADSMYTALEWAVYPKDDPEGLMAFLNDFGRWLAKEAARRLP